MSVRQRAMGRIALAVSLVGLVACGGEETTQPLPKGGAGGDVPSVRIEAHPARGPAPLTVAFSAAVTGAKGDKALAWDFADSKTGSGLQVTHEFAEPGTYQVRVTASDADGDEGSDVVTIVVWSNKKPEAWAHADVTRGEAPLRVAFQAIAGGGDGALSYAWELGDGAKSNVANPVHVYEAAGEFTASLKVTDENGDEASAEVRIVVEPAEPATALSVVARIVSGACGLPNRTEVSLDASATVHPAGEPLLFQWIVTRSPAESGGGTFSNREAPTTFFYPDAAGDYEIRLFVRDLDEQYASAPLRVVADDAPALISIVGGDHQTARAGEVFELPLLINITNRCGLPLPEVRVDWNGTNAAGERSRTTSDRKGGAWNNVRAGGRIGEAQVRAVAGRDGNRVEADFSLEVVAGTPALVLMDAVSDVEVSNTQGATLTFRVTDAYGNPLTDQEADIVLSTMGSPVPATFEAFDNGLTTTSISTTSGVATVQLFSAGAAGLARVEVVSAALQSTGRLLRGGGWREVARHDFESGELDWRRIGDWEIGAPTSGPNAAHGGTGVLATNLAGNFEHQPIPTLPHQATTTVALLGGGYPQYFRLRFSHWYELGALQAWRPENERAYDEPAPTQCAPASAQVYFGAGALSRETPFGEPYASAPGVGPCWDPYDRWGDHQFTGASSGWQEVELWTIWSSSEATALLGFLLESNASEALPNGPGWYVDDVAIDSFGWGYGLVGFVPNSTPRSASVTARALASANLACATPAVIEVGLLDAFGNPTLAAGVPVELTVSYPDASASVSGFLAGGNPSGTGTATASATTDENGVVVALVSVGAPLLMDPISVTASLPGVADSSASLEAGLSMWPLLSESSTAFGCEDGVDNDCDGLVDCADPDCFGVGPCAGLSCASPVFASAVPEGSSGFAGSLCGWGENGLGVDPPAGHNDVVISLTGSGTYGLCLTGPEGVQVEVGDTSGGETCGYLELFEFGEGCHLFSLIDGTAEHYFVVRAPAGECGAVTLVVGRMDLD